MSSLNEKKRNGDVDAYESYIPDWSPLIGKSLTEIMKGFEDKIIVDHIHESPIEIESKKEVTPTTIFKKGMSIKIFGDWTDICLFTDKYALP